MSEILGRVHGTEMEWGGMTSSHTGQYALRQISSEEIHQPIKRFLHEQGIPSVGSVENQFLGNGARFYDDINSLREYATAEDTSFEGTTASEIASERIFQGIAEHYEAQTGSRLNYTKRVVDDEFHGSGYHVSFCCDRSVLPVDESSGRVKTDNLALFGLYAATRGVLFGAGALLPGSVFTVSQKSLTLSSDYSPATTSGKPVVNLRDEPLADKTKYARFHDTSSDPNMSPWASRVKLGTASLVLRLIEHGHQLPELQPTKELFQVSQDVALDPTVSKRFALLGGLGLTAIEIQQRIAQAVTERLVEESIPLPSEELWALNEWHRTLADLKQSRSLVADRIEWVTKLAALERMHERHGWPWSSALLRAKDKQFSDISERSIGRALREKTWAAYMPSEQLIIDRMQSPPATTRAKIRGDFIARIEKRHRNRAGVNWHVITYDQHPHLLPDPYQTKSRLVEAINLDWRHPKGRHAAQ